jgi:hypothetical protein
MEPETDPRKIAEALEQTRRQRRESKPKSSLEAAEQLLRHCMEAGQITKTEFEQKMEQVKRETKVMKSEADSESGQVQPRLRQVPLA